MLSAKTDGELQVRITIKTLAGIAVCAATALSLTMFLRDGTTIRLAAPAICIQAVIITALFWGRTSAFIGAIIAGVTFALWLYPPYGHLWVRDPAERVTLTLFELAALCVVRLTPPDSSRTAPQNGGGSWGLHNIGFSFKRQPRRTKEVVTRGDAPQSER